MAVIGMPPLGFSLELDKGTTFHQCCASSLASNPEARQLQTLSSCLCPARHLRTWLMTYTRKVLDVGSARPAADCALFHAHTTHSATGSLLLPGHVAGTAS